MVVEQGDVWWAELGTPLGSAPGYRKPVIIIQDDDLNRSRLATTICVVMTTNLAWGHLPLNLLLPAKTTGLPRDSLAQAAAIATVDRGQLIEHVSKLPAKHLEQFMLKVERVLGRSPQGERR